MFSRFVVEAWGIEFASENNRITLPTKLIIRVNINRLICHTRRKLVFFVASIWLLIQPRTRPYNFILFQLFLQILAAKWVSAIRSALFLLCHPILTISTIILPSFITSYQMLIPKQIMLLLIKFILGRGLSSCVHMLRHLVLASQLTQIMRAIDNLRAFWIYTDAIIASLNWNVQKSWVLLIVPSLISFIFKKRISMGLKNWTGRLIGLFFVTTKHLFKVQIFLTWCIW